MTTTLEVTVKRRALQSRAPSFSYMVKWLGSFRDLVIEGKWVTLVELISTRWERYDQKATSDYIYRLVMVTSHRMARILSWLFYVSEFWEIKSLFRRKKIQVSSS